MNLLAQFISPGMLLSWMGTSPLLVQATQPATERQREASQKAESIEFTTACPVASCAPTPVLKDSICVGLKHRWEQSKATK